MSKDKSKPTTSAREIELQALIERLQKELGEKQIELEQQTTLARATWSNWQAALTTVARQDGEIVILLDAKRALENDCLIKDAAYDKLVHTADKLERRVIKAERANGALMIAAGLGFIATRR